MINTEILEKMEEFRKIESKMTLDEKKDFLKKLNSIVKEMNIKMERLSEKNI